MPTEHIKYEDTLRQGTDKINNAIDQANKAEADSEEALTTANQALQNSESTQTQLDTIVIEGDSSVEAAQARVNADGSVTYTTLKDRLDTEYTEVTSKFADLAINVKTFGAKGDGITDDTLSIQNAVNSVTSGTIYFPEGDYIISNTIIFKKGHKFVGASRTGATIENINDSVFAFSYMADGATTQHQGQDSGIVFESLTIKSKNGIKINDEASFDTQYAVLGIIINNVILIGKYGSAIDPNYRSPSIIPEQSELDGFGVGLAMCKIFNSSIQNSQINQFGTGIRLYGSDINQITNCRTMGNARHFYSEYRKSGSFGSQNKIENCDILQSERLGGIFLEGSFWHSIRDNFFENAQYGDTGQYIRTNGDLGTLIDGNRFNSTSSSITPYISLNSRYGVRVVNNRYNPRTPDPIIEIKYDYYDNQFIDMYRFDNNMETMPIPDVPLVHQGKPDPFVYKYNNFPFNPSGQAVQTYPFITSPVTGRWVFQTTTDYFELRFPIKKGHRRYVVEYIGRYVANNTGYHTVKLRREDNTEIELESGYLGFTKTDETEVIREGVVIPDSEQAEGQIKITIANTEVEYESIELIPVDYLLDNQPPTTGTYKVGDKVINSNPTAGSYEGWVCVSAGSPGTWKGYGLIES